MLIKTDRHIEIVRTTVKAVSSLSQESCDAIYSVLAKHYDNVGVTIINSVADLESLAANRPDLVFLGMKFVPVNRSLGAQDTQRVWVADYLDSLGIAYTGSNHLAHELELNKPLAKCRVQDAGLNTSKFYVMGKNYIQTADDAALGFPLFVKPKDRGGGVGVDSDSVVHTTEQLKAKVESIATKFQSESLVESYLPGREFSVAILKDEHSPTFSIMPLELIAEPDERGARLLSSQIKSSNSERVIAVTDKVIKSNIMALAYDVFCALGARDYGRVDIRLDGNGTPQFLEANLLPSLISGYGSFPKACMLNEALDYEPMLLQIVRLGLARSQDVTNYDSAVDMLEETPQTSLGTALEPVI